MHIAIVEDEPKLVALLNEYLLRENYQTSVYSDGMEALKHLQFMPPDLILLDLKLPGLDGLSICKKLREKSTVPIIMLTARVGEIDRVLGLELGADDYICKPYSPREVVARVKTVLRRTGAAVNINKNDSIVLQEKGKKVRVNGAVCTLTPVEFSLLKTMHEYPGRAYNRNQLMKLIYPDNRIVSDRTIDSHVKRVRQKLKAIDSENNYLHSIYRLGYKYDEGVRA